KQQLQQALREARKKFKALRKPKKETIELLKNIYITPSAANSTNSQSLNSTFGNKDSIGSPFGGSNTFGQSTFPQVGNPTSNSIFGQNSFPLARNQTTSSIFGQNSVAQVGNSASNNIFGQNSSPQVGTASAGSIFGQNLTTQGGNASSGSMFGQSPTTQVFSPQDSGGIFGQQSSPFGQNSVFGNTNQSVFDTAAPPITNNLPNTSPHQTNLFQTNQGQGIFPGGNHAQTNPSNSMFATNSQSQPFNQLNNDRNQSYQSNSIFSQGVTQIPFISQNTSVNNQNSQSNSIFTNQNSQTNSVFNQNTNSILNTQQASENSVQVFPVCESNITKSQISINCKECSGLSKKSFLDVSSKNSQKKFVCHECFKQALLVDSSDGEEEHSVVESGGKTNGSKRSSGSLHIDDPSNAEVIKLIETKFTKLERSLQYSSEIMDDLRTKFDTLLRDNQKLKKENEALKVRMNRMESDMEPMKTKMDKEEIVQESCNLVLVGLKDSQDNGVGVQKVVQTTDPETTSNDYVIEVLPSKAPRKPILLKFKNAETCKRVFSSYKAGVRKLTTTSCEIDKENTALYLYEDLPKSVRLLLKQAK
ncbi:hypothetical protein HHI36_015903, partial [Cryptolaemus montrouzieri]